MVIDENEKSTAAIKRDRLAYDAALRSIERGVADLSTLGFTISKGRIESRQLVMTIEATARKDAA